MKRLICILVTLCSATMTCNGEDPVDPNWGRSRPVAPRLSNADYEPCCRKPPVREQCDEPIASRERALELLVVAGDPCLDKVMTAVAKYAKDDLAAAYLIRGERNGDPVDFLRGLNLANGFNRALAQQKLFLKKEAIVSWDAVARSNDDRWGEEARAHFRTLRTPEPSAQWSAAEVDEALKEGNRARLRAIVHAFPSTAIRYFESTFDPLHARASRLFADAIAEGGEPYARAIVEAAERTPDRKAWVEGVQAFRAHDFERAARLLQRAGNPFALEATFYLAAVRFIDGDPLPILDAIAPVVTSHGYRDLGRRIEALRANALEFQNRYLEAHPVYERALALAAGDPTATVEILSRRSANYTTVGRPDLAFVDAFHALQLLGNVTNVSATHQTYAAAAQAADKLGYPRTAIQYQNAAIEPLQKLTLSADARVAREAKHHLAIALRQRADFHIRLGHDDDARADLGEARGYAEAVGDHKLRDLLRMRIAEVQGEIDMKTNPVAAERSFSQAIELAREQDSTYQAVLHFKRAGARRERGDPAADQDIAEALAILRAEATSLLDSRKRGEYEELWSPYFARFQSKYHEVIAGRIAAGDTDGAFLAAEQARAFEPLHLLLSSQSVPEAFHKLDTRDELARQLRTIPEDTAIVQYVSMEDRAYAFVLARDQKIVSVPLAVSRDDIERWVREQTDAVHSGQATYFTLAMRSAYGGLFRYVLANTAAATKSRIVIVPDGPMYGLAFAALEHDRRFLVQRATLATAGSASLYLYALARDATFPSARPRLTVVGNPQTERPPLPGAKEEAMELGRAYGNADVLIGREATIERFLDSARDSTIIHFAGHAVGNPRSPWLSMLLLTPQGGDSGQLTAERLMTELSQLNRTRLVVLAACSTAGGQTVGPEGLSPLVRPLIAANVPAVVGTLWDVNDATAKDLLVSLHCHYRHGDDVAVALQQAQLAMLRTGKSAMQWAPFQVVGHAGSPFRASIAQEETSSDDICSEDSLHRPHGLHSQ